MTWYLGFLVIIYLVELQTYKIPKIFNTKFPRFSIQFLAKLIFCGFFRMFLKREEAQTLLLWIGFMRLLRLAMIRISAENFIFNLQKSKLRYE
ncbi:hypothetical protein C7Y71_006765 [Pseudoprevotella muciniphila]|uniref:Uncharacterized protein n=1 Tax=Pseudoprevotella muciniphila TaxID=2133944 RepID=A0A5P8E726_9BACT|nr:hypothetical protein C7Y71_006765 [Pseudoprevotella muciniphila]